MRQSLTRTDTPVKAQTAMGDARIHVSVGSGVLPVVHDNRKKEPPDATAGCNDREPATGVRGGEGDAGRRTGPSPPCATIPTICSPASAAGPLPGEGRSGPPMPANDGSARSADEPGPREPSGTGPRRTASSTRASSTTTGLGESVPHSHLTHKSLRHRESRQLDKPRTLVAE